MGSKLSSPPRPRDHFDQYSIMLNYVFFYIIRNKNEFGLVQHPYENIVFLQSYYYKRTSASYIRTIIVS